jgi:cytochrome c556
MARQFGQYLIAGLGLILAGWMAAGCDAAPGSTAAQAASPVTPRLSVNALMVTMIDNAGHVLWDAEREGFAPKDEADWLELEDHATQLAAAGTLIQLGGTGQADMGWIRQRGWNESADAMTEAALAALAAAKIRNLEGVRKANGELVDSCESCHKAFKPELPTEGIAHQRPHSDSHATR